MPIIWAGISQFSELISGLRVVIVIDHRFPYAPAGQTVAVLQESVHESYQVRVNEV